MGPNVVLFGWNRPVPGREQLSSRHFDDFVTFLTAGQTAGKIQSFDVVFLDAHGGDLNGFFLIRAEAKKLDAFLSSAEWITHMTRADLHLEGTGVIRGATGDAVASRMEIWRKAIPT